MFCKNVHVDHSLTTFDDLDYERLRDIAVVAFWFPNAQVWTLYGYLKDTFMHHLESEQQNRTSNRLRCMAPLLAGHGNVYESFEDSVDFLLQLEDIDVLQPGRAVTVHRHMWYDARTDTYTPRQTAGGPVPIEVADNRVLTRDLDITPLEGRICTKTGKRWTKKELRERLRAPNLDYSKDDLCILLSQILSKMSNDDQHIMSMRRVEPGS